MRLFTRGIAQMEGERVNEEVESEDIDFRTRRVVYRRWREPMSLEERGVDIMEHSWPNAGNWVSKDNL